MAPSARDAFSHYRRGDFRSAERAARQALATTPNNPDLLQLLASALVAQGKAREAVKHLETVLKAGRATGETLYNLGTTLFMAGRPDEAAARLRQACAVRPQDPDYHNNLGIALLAARQFEAAEAAFDRTLQLRADWPVAHYNKGRAAAGQGRHQDAVDCYRRAAKVLARPQPELLAHLANSLQELGLSSEALEHWDLALSLDPNYAHAHCGRGSALARLKRSTDALLSFDRALALNAGLCEAHHGRGKLLAEQLRRPGEALLCYERAVALNPRYVHAHCGRGNALYVLRRPFEALAAYDCALALDADFAQAHCGRGNCLHELKRQGEALTSFDRALALDPEYSEAYHGRGNALSDLKRHCEALESYERAVSVGTREPCLSLAGALHMASMMCDWAALERVKANLSREPTGAYTPFPIVCVLDDPALQQSAAQQFIFHFVPGVNATRDARNSLGTAQSSRPLRIGYLSADFRLHPIAFLISELIEIHDRTRFRIYGFSAGIDDGSQERARLQNAFDVFIDVRSKSNSELVRLIREAEIDVLVELGGHTGDSRMFALVEGAAPIQVTYLGYPATTGAPFIDYAIVDRFVVPEGSETFFTEKLVYMPDCFHVIDRKRCVSERPPSRAECGLPEAGFVFCCFNNSYKIGPSVFDVWVRLLNAVPESVLWLVGETPWVRENLRKEAAARAADPARLVFAPKIPYAEHLARQRAADLFLDTWPYNAGTTASDALWVGLPVLTCAGRSFASRMAGSLLHAVGLPELITHSTEAYEALAIELAESPQRLQTLRERLIENRRTAPLFSTERFARNLEAAFAHMWERHCRGETPESFAPAINSI